MKRINAKKARRAAQQAAADRELIRRAEAAGGKLEIINRGGVKQYALTTRHQLAAQADYIREPTICSTFNAANMLVTIEEQKAAES